MPLQLGKCNLQGGVHGFRGVAAAFGILDLDKVHDGGDVGGERRGAGEVFVASGVPVKDGAGEDFLAGVKQRRPGEDVLKVGLEEADFVGHGAGGVHDKGDVNNVAGRSLIHRVGVDDGFLRVPFPYLGHALLHLPVHGNGALIGRYRALHVRHRQPEVGRALVVRDGFPKNVIPLQEFHAHALDRLSVRVHKLYGDALGCVQAPIGVHAGIVAGHDIAPELPVGKVVPFGRGYYAGLSASAQVAATAAGEGLVRPSFV